MREALFEAFRRSAGQVDLLLQKSAEIVKLSRSLREESDRIKVLTRQLKREGRHSPSELLWMRRT